MLSLVRLERKQKILQIRNFEFAHFSFFLTDFELNDKPGSYTTSFSGFSPTRPTELRRAGRREPWERGWFIHSVVPSRTIPDPRLKWANCTGVFILKRRKNTKKPDGAAHTYTAYKREYPQDCTAKIS